jgi:hypothetical protein
MALVALHSAMPQVRRMREQGGRVEDRFSPAPPTVEELA